MSADNIEGNSEKVTLFTSQPKEAFDTVHMRKLFDMGYRKAKGGYPWLEYPPRAEIK